jgi:hypothetical protein
MMDALTLGQRHQGRKMNADAIARVEHVDTRANLGGLLPDGGDREPAALLWPLGRSAPTMAPLS